MHPLEALYGEVKGLEGTTIIVAPAVFAGEYDVVPMEFVAETFAIMTVP